MKHEQQRKEKRGESVLYNTRNRHDTRVKGAQIGHTRKQRYR